MINLKEFEVGELRKFVLLSAIFALIIGIYWFLRPIKDGIFITLVGADFLPYAQIASLIAIMPILGIYSKLVDRLQRHHLFYVMAGIFSLSLACFAYFLDNFASSSA